MSKWGTVLWILQVWNGNLTDPLQTGWVCHFVWVSIRFLQFKLPKAPHPSQRLYVLWEKGPYIILIQNFWNFQANLHLKAVHVPILWKLLEGQGFIFMANYIWNRESKNLWRTCIKNTCIWSEFVPQLIQLLFFR